MKPYIAVISSPPADGLGFIEERRLIVVEVSPEKADAALRKLAPQNWSYTLTDEEPPEGYVEAAKLQPGVVRHYNP